MQYDVDAVVIGTGAGGGTAALSLARAGLTVLMVERGPLSLPRHTFQNEEKMLVRMEPFEGRTILKNGTKRRLFNGGIAGGGTSLYGAVLLRPAPEDFTPGKYYRNYLGNELDEWPITYDDLAPWYDKAEELYRVSGDPIRQPKFLGKRRSAYPANTPPLEPISQKLNNALEQEGVSPFHLPLAIDFNTCLHCPTCPGYLCPTNARSSSLHVAVEPAVAQYGAELWCNSEAIGFVKRGTEIQSVQIQNRTTGKIEEVRAKTYLLSAGAIGSAALLLKSGIGNSSGLLGRNYMYHAGAVAAGVFAKPQGTADRFAKQIGYTDDYFGTPDYPHKLGYAQVLPVPGPHSLLENSPVPLPLSLAEVLYERAVTLAGTVEDLPQPTNRVTVGKDGQIRLDHRFHPYDIERSRHMLKRLRRVMKRAGASLVIGMTGDQDEVHTAHQVGTARFGKDPATSVLNSDCRLHDIDNLYVVDGSFMPTSLGVGPALTIIANAMRVADRIVKEGI